MSTWRRWPGSAEPHGSGAGEHFDLGGERAVGEDVEGEAGRANHLHVFGVEIDGDEVAEIGPGAVLGERALLEGGERTATLRAKTKCRVAVVSPEMLDRASLERLAASRAVT